MTWEIDELMIAALARELPDDTRAFNGAASFIPVCAFLLARETHAPDLVWVASSIAVDPRPPRIPESTLSDGLWGGASMLQSSAFDFWWYAQNGRLNTFCFRGAQIDAYGNVNNTVIGPYATPKVRLPGGGGMADLSCLVPRVYIWSTTHTPRVFVPRLDFRSGIGWGDGPGDRERLGLAGGPRLVVTNLCVMDFAPRTRRMRIRSLHPGVSVDDVRAATGFDVEVEGAVPTTPEPTPEEIEIIRRVDPTGMRKRELAG
jgi:glutaconate CoA-transferase, subunit B